MDNHGMEVIYSLVMITLFLPYSSPAYVGCYKDLENHRVFPHEKPSSTDMNVEMCIKECSGNRYAGVENGDECWCGASVDDDTKVAEDHCRMQCSGDHGQICGDAWYISVYTTASDFSNVVTKGYISSASGLHMVSGLAASRAHPGYLYAINDNAGADKIYMWLQMKIDNKEMKRQAIGQRRTVLATKKKTTVEEDTGYERKGLTLEEDRYTGSQHHNQATVYAIKEPSATHTQNVQVAATYGYKWSEGSSEAMVVDSSGDVYMFSENSGKPAHMAKLPSQNWNNGKVNTIYSTLTLPFTSSNSGPLAADISPSGTDMLIKTLNHIYYWSMPDKSVTNARFDILALACLMCMKIVESLHWIWRSPAKNTVYKIKEPKQIKTQNVHLEKSLHFTWSKGSSEALMVDKMVMSTFCLKPQDQEANWQNCPAMDGARAIQ
ncbi:uncharacterized protein LOC124271317 [Haliotis rubra]|uniref:uncharacterized protein LOC124271317 n=1 Tax=Haliotis rubra TaxID=36100 RepID=UPI001EE5C946|nr:uncharacterized protein LOC124271317 [Haliotis rubra]